MTSLGTYTGRWGVGRPTEDAVVFEAERLTWAELHRRVDATARAAQELGVAPGDRIGVLLDNRLDWPVAFLCAWRIGAVVVPLNARFGPFELRNIEEDANCRLLITTGRCGGSLADRFRLDAGAAQDGIVLAPRLEHDLAARRYDDVLAVNARPTLVLADGDAIAAIFYTSGTTGLPKGTMHSHASIQACLLSLTMACGFNEADCALLVAPLAFTGMALCNLLPMIAMGARVVIERDLVPARVLELVAGERVTYLMVVPAIWERLSCLPAFADADLSSLRLAGTGGAPIPPVLLETFRRRGLVIKQTYGSTEGGGIVCVPTDARALAEPTACGACLPSLAMRVVDDTGREAPAGVVGELQLSGAQLMRGYWNNPAATAAAFIRGWYRTGDLGRLDADGSLTVLDRKKNMIISGGVNIYPAEIERAMASIECVAEVAVFGMPDERWGERAVALVRAACDTTVEAIYDEARALLGAIKAPRDIVLLAEQLPRTVTNKVARAELPALYGRARADG